MALDNDVYTQLNASWNAGVIAKPKFYTGERPETGENNVLFIEEDESLEYQIETVDKQDAGIGQVKITISSKLEADITNYLAEIRRIINAYAGTNTSWHVDRRKIQKHTGNYKLICIVRMYTSGV